MQPNPPPVMIGEVLTSPGPRKNAKEENSPHTPELAEDSAGILMINGQSSWIWVADGASDMHALAGFSSRILAQELGREFISQVLNQPEASDISPATLSKNLEAAVHSITNSWNTRLKNDSHLKATLVQQLEAWQINHGGPENANVFFEFASTFSAACLKSSGHLSGISVGDSFLMTNPNGLLQFFALKKGAVTLRMKLDHGSPVFSSSAPAPETFENQEVNLTALATDGTRETLQHLNKALPPDFILTPQNLAGFKKTLSSASPKSQDDKTFAWLGRIHAG